jgi:hypothetical protein
MITLARSHPAAKDVVRPCGVGEYEWDNEECPPNVKPILSEGAAASQIEIEGGMMFGHRLIASPL